MHRIIIILACSLVPSSGLQQVPQALEVEDTATLDVPGAPVIKSSILHMRRALEVEDATTLNAAPDAPVLPALAEDSEEEDLDAAVASDPTTVVTTTQASVARGSANNAAPGAAQAADAIDELAAFAKEVPMVDSSATNANNIASIAVENRENRARELPPAHVSQVVEEQVIQNHVASAVAEYHTADEALFAPQADHEDTFESGRLEAPRTATAATQTVLPPLDPFYLPPSAKPAAAPLRQSSGYPQPSMQLRQSTAGNAIDPKASLAAFHQRLRRAERIREERAKLTRRLIIHQNKYKGFAHSIHPTAFIFSIICGCMLVACLMKFEIVVR